MPSIYKNTPFISNSIVKKFADKTKEDRYEEYQRNYKDRTVDYDDTKVDDPEIEKLVEEYEKQTYDMSDVG